MSITNTTNIANLVTTTNTTNPASPFFTMNVLHTIDMLVLLILLILLILLLLLILLIVLMIFIELLALILTIGRGEWEMGGRGECWRMKRSRIREDHQGEEQEHDRMWTGPRRKDEQEDDWRRGGRTVRCSEVYWGGGYACVGETWGGMRCMERWNKDDADDCGEARAGIWSTQAAGNLISVVFAWQSQPIYIYIYTLLNFPKIKIKSRTGKIPPTRGE